MAQLDLFGTPQTLRQILDAPAIPLNPTVAPEDAPRLSLQHVAILDRLRQGPATNLDLATIGQRFGARIEELRKAGYSIETKRVGPGINQYTLAGEPV